nr:Dihydrofolate reductase [uncultured bacterium]AIA12968.1 Dihydrofolate reductase [uncultured bacterium]
MILSAIAAMAQNRVIGKDGTLPWKIPEDFKFFKDKTTGHIMIMGRKTFDSLGGPLPKRLHVVITRQKDYAPEGAIVARSVEHAVELTREILAKKEWPEEVFIIGGGQIYEEMLSKTDRIYLTEIHRTFDGDARFPEFSKNEFSEVERSHRDQPVPFDFVTYERNRR